MSNINLNGPAMPNQIGSKDNGLSNATPNTKNADAIDVTTFQDIMNAGSLAETRLEELKTELGKGPDLDGDGNLTQEEMQRYQDLMDELMQIQNVLGG